MAKPVFRTDPERTALLVCDIQERFRSAIWNFDAVVSTARKMVNAAKILGMPVLTTEQNPKALGSTVAEIGLDSLGLLNVGVVAKSQFSMATDSVLENLSENNIASVIIVGIESHVCVLYTALQLAAYGFGDIYVLADGISSCNPQEIGIALERMRATQKIHISTSESMLFQLLGDANHPEFKAVSKLIKDDKNNTKAALAALLGQPKL